MYRQIRGKNQGKEGKFKGETVEYNDVDFNFDNELLLYQGKTFTGRITYKGKVSSGYFTFNMGALEGDFEINYSDGNKEKGEFTKNRLINYTNIYGKNMSYIEYESSEKGNTEIKNIKIKKGDEEYNFEAPLLSSGEIKKMGKMYKLNSSGETSSQILVEEKGNFYIYEYILSDDDISEIKYKTDGKNYKYMIEKERNTVYRTDNKIAGFDIYGVANILRNADTDDAGADSEVSSSVQSGDSSDDDLAVLDKVYDEVINKGNSDYLNNFSKEKLGIIRNTLFAKRGYIFKTEKYRNYFSSKSWYHGTTYSDNLSPDEKKLADIIKSRE